MYPKQVKPIYSTVDFILSVGRLLAKTRFRKTKKIDRKHDRCIIMGNGPSLVETLEKNKEHLNGYDLIAVNHMASTPQYEEYKPDVYVLVDPAFWFSKEMSDFFEEKVKLLYTNIMQKTTWKMQLYIPHEAEHVKEVKQIPVENKNVQLRFFNRTKFEGNKTVSHWIYDKQWGMPRPQNVLVAAMMLPVYSEYKRIYLAGAENDFIKNIWIDECNRVRFDDKHFYEQNKNEAERVLPGQYSHFLAAMYHTYSSYYVIADFAKKKKNQIYNATPHSLIDAFDRNPLN